MKKCKKLTALLMASIMGLSLFGCSSGKDAPTTAASQAPETKAPETKAPEASATGVGGLLHEVDDRRGGR